MNFGDQLSKKKSFALLDQAVKEHAINFIVSYVICNHKFIAACPSITYHRHHSCTGYSRELSRAFR